MSDFMNQPKGSSDSSWHHEPEENTEAFADRFERQWNEMIADEPGASDLDPALWQRIQHQATAPKERRTRRVKPRPATRSVERSAYRLHSRSRTHTTPVPPLTAGGRAGQRNRWFSTIAAVMGLVILIAGVWYSPLGPGNLFDEDVPVRYAAEVSVSSASPSRAATQDLSAYLPLDIPGVACEVEPLTEDEVFGIVHNPNVRRATFMGHSTTEEYPAAPMDAGNWSYVENFFHFSLPDYGVVPSESEYAAMREAADQFWNCLRVGTAYQVWSLMNPELVQLEILRNFPVFRDEDDVQGYIARFGPLRYSAGITMVFPDLDGGAGPFAERYAEPDHASAIVADEAAQPGWNLPHAYVSLRHETDPSNTYVIVLADYGDGVWRAVGQYWGS